MPDGQEELIAMQNVLISLLLVKAYQQKLLITDGLAGDVTLSSYGLTINDLRSRYAIDEKAAQISDRDYADKVHLYRS